MTIRLIDAMERIGAKNAINALGMATRQGIAMRSCFAHTVMRMVMQLEMGDAKPFNKHLDLQEGRRTVEIKN